MPKSLTLSICTLSLAATTSTAFADEVAQNQNEISLFSTLTSGGIIGLVIIITSLIAVAMIADNFIRIRREKLIPESFNKKLEGLFKQSQFEEARQLCQKDNSFIAKVIDAGLAQHNSILGFYDMQKAMQECSERYIASLYRKLDYLAFIGAVAPMLGLLGTVTGMIKSFNQIAITEGAAKASQLAGGISEALVTTCLGLIVAIPAMFFVTFFRNKIDGFVAQAEPIVDQLMGPFRNDENGLS